MRPRRHISFHRHLLAHRASPPGERLYHLCLLSVTRRQHRDKDKSKELRLPKNMSESNTRQLRRLEKEQQRNRTEQSIIDKLHRCDTQFLTILDDFMAHATSEQPRIISMQATDNKGVEVYKSEVEMQCGKVTTPSETVRDNTQRRLLNSLVQFRKLRLLQLTPDEAEQRHMMQILTPALASTKYGIGSAQRRNSILRINPAVLRKSRTLLCMDSYGNSQSAEQYTTPNVTTMALPGARLITVVKAAATLSNLAMDQPSEVILFASTNDYLSSHTIMLARRKFRNVERDSKDAADV